MNINITPKLSFQAHPMKYRPTVMKINNEDKSYGKEQARMVEIDLDNKKDIETLSNLSENWTNANLVTSIYSEAKEMSENEEYKLDYRFFVITSQKDNFENLDPEKIISVCEIEETEDDNSAFIEYIQSHPDSTHKIYPEYKRGASAMLDGLKYYYNDIKLYAIPTKDVLKFYARNDFRASTTQKHLLQWNKDISFGGGIKEDNSRNTFNANIDTEEILNELKQYGKTVVTVNDDLIRYKGEREHGSWYTNRRNYLKYIKDPELAKLIKQGAIIFKQDIQKRTEDYRQGHELEILMKLCEKCSANCINDYVTNRTNHLQDYHMIEFANRKYNEYLNNLNIPQNIKLQCKEIAKKYGTKVFLPAMIEYNDSYNTLKLINDEFAQWYRFGGKRAKFPAVLDFTAAKADYVNNKRAYGISAAAGIAHFNNSKIDIDGLYPYTVQNILRHEMTHINDTKKLNSVDDGVIVKKQSNKLRDDGIWEISEEIDFDNCKYREEFLKSGIRPDYVKYAYNNPQEFIAVASEGDMSKFSSEFKKLLISYGMPEWMFEMENSSTEIQFQISNNEQLLKMYPGKKLEEIMFPNIAKILNESLQTSKLISDFYKDIDYIRKNPTNEIRNQSPGVIKYKINGKSGVIYYDKNGMIIGGEKSTGEYFGYDENGNYKILTFDEYDSVMCQRDVENNYEKKKIIEYRKQQKAEKEREIQESLGALSGKDREISERILKYESESDEIIDCIYNNLLYGLNSETLAIMDEMMMASKTCENQLFKNINNIKYIAQEMYNCGIKPEQVKKIIEAKDKNGDYIANISTIDDIIYNGFNDINI